MESFSNDGASARMDAMEMITPYGVIMVAVIPVGMQTKMTVWPVMFFICVSNVAVNSF